MVHPHLKQLHGHEILKYNCHLTFLLHGYVSRTKYNTKSTKKCRKQVIKTFSMREGWWHIGIIGGGGVNSKGTRVVIEKEK